MVVVQARSLATLNLLAARPPATPPRHASYGRHEPLTLYISRVPGTRDILLSTFRPGMKNVTAEDVASSMYYVHLELPVPISLTTPASIPIPIPIPIPASAPASVLQELSPRSLNAQRPGLVEQSHGRSSFETPEFPFPKRIRRKPVPSSSATDTSHSSRSGSSPASMRALPSALTTPSGCAIEDVPSLDLPPPIPLRHPRHSFDLLSVPGPRKLVMSRPKTPIQLPSWESLSESTKTTSSASTSRSPTLCEDAPYDRKHSTDSSLDTPLPRRAYPPLASNWARFPPGPTPSTPSSHPASPALFTLTLIRREPSSSSQWNVGKITSREGRGTLSDRGAGDGGDRPLLAPAFRIHIDTEGYAKFADRTQLRKLGGTDRNPLQFPGFHREVTASYGKSWTSNLRGVFQRSHGGGKTAAAWSAGGHLRHGSAPRPIESSRHERNSENQGTNTNTNANTNASANGGGSTRVKGYDFRSPWDGRCEFRSIDGGRILRCTHTLDDHGNPLVEPGKEAVSELRFNTPMPAHVEHGRSQSEPDGGAGRHQVHGHFSKLFRPRHEDAHPHHHRHPDGDDDGDDGGDDNDYGGAGAPASPFELNLGKEHAGGGHRGKRAKLGKLIVYNEGLSMLDLVIAANMGVFMDMQS